MQLSLLLCESWMTLLDAIAMTMVFRMQGRQAGGERSQKPRPFLLSRQGQVQLCVCTRARMCVWCIKKGRDQAELC